MSDRLGEGWSEILEQESRPEDVPSGAGLQALSSKRRGRPPGLTGSHAYRAALRTQEKELQAEEASRPHSVHDARKVLQQKRAQRTNLEIARRNTSVTAVSSAGSTLQQKLAIGVMSQSLKSLLPEIPDAVAQGLLAGISRPVTSKTAEALRHQTSRGTLDARTLQCASGVINFSGLLWEQLLRRVAGLIDAGLYTPVCFIKKRRYDETPSRIKVEVPTGKSDNTFAKVLQSECQLTLLLKENKSEKFVLLTSHWPTWLQAIDRNTAETIRYCQEQLEAVIPFLHQVSKLFPIAISLVNTDRFAANFKCERSMEQSQKHYIRTHYGCDHHAVATVLGKAFGLPVPKAHISAMISAALSMTDANSLQSFREALMTVIAQKLRVRIGPAPAGLARSHRGALYNLLLGDLPSVPHRHSLRGRGRRRARQRIVLSHFFNGDLEDAEHIDFWTTALNPSKEQILQDFWAWVVPALVPSKADLFPRGKWTNSELCIDWFALIDCHHQLLGPTVSAWLGVTVAGSSAVEGDSDALLSLESDPHTLGDLVLQDAVESENEAEHAPLAAEKEDKSTEWAKKRQTFRKRFQEWSAASPAASLVVMRIAITPSINFTYALLNLVGEKWEKEQQKKLLSGEKRSYPVLEAARGTLLQDFWRGMKAAFHTAAVAIPSQCWTRTFQVLLFKMLSCIGTAMAVHVQVRWQSFPVRLFSLLDGVDHGCLLEECPAIGDDLAQAFYKKYTSPVLRQGEEAHAVLIALASAFTLGIAEIEARHATTRRVATVKGTQTHVPCLADVSAEWVCRRNSSMKQSAALFPESCKKAEATGEADTSEAAPESSQDRRVATAWHAFLNEKLCGQRLKDVALDLSAEYHALTNEEWEKYAQMGRLAQLSAARGFNAFKREPPGMAGSSGTAGALQIAPANASLALPSSSAGNLNVAKLERDISRHAAMAKEELQLQKSQENALKFQIAQFRETSDDSAVLPMFEWVDASARPLFRLQDPCSFLQMIRVHMPADLWTQASVFSNSLPLSEYNISRANTLSQVHNPADVGCSLTGDCNGVLGKSMDFNMRVFFGEGGAVVCGGG